MPKKTSTKKELDAIKKLDESAELAQIRITIAAQKAQEMIDDACKVATDALTAAASPSTDRSLNGSYQWNRGDRFRSGSDDRLERLEEQIDMINIAKNLLEVGQATRQEQIAGLKGQSKSIVQSEIEIREQLDLLRNRIDESLTATSHKFEEALAGTNKKFEDALAATNKKFDDTLAATNRKFEEVMETRNTTSNSALAANNKKFEDALLATNTKFDNALLATNKKFDDALSATNTKFEENKNYLNRWLVGILATLLTSVILVVLTQVIHLR
jgi:hypothetical protein